MLDFALGQVARQRGVDDLELVLAPHGFDADEARVRDLLGPGIGLRRGAAAGGRDLRRRARREQRARPTAT